MIACQFEHHYHLKNLLHSCNALVVVIVETVFVSHQAKADIALLAVDAAVS